jgi:hypothetical protein
MDESTLHTADVPSLHETTSPPHVHAPLYLQRHAVPAGAGVVIVHPPLEYEQSHFADGNGATSLTVAAVHSPPGCSRPNKVLFLAPACDEAICGIASRGGAAGRPGSETADTFMSLKPLARAVCTHNSGRAAAGSSIAAQAAGRCVPGSAGRADDRARACSPTAGRPPAPRRLVRWSSAGVRLNRGSPARRQAKAFAKALPM